VFQVGSRDAASLPIISLFGDPYLQHENHLGYFCVSAQGIDLKRPNAADLCPGRAAFIGPAAFAVCLGTAFRHRLPRSARICWHPSTVGPLEAQDMARISIGTNAPCNVLSSATGLLSGDSDATPLR